MYIRRLQLWLGCRCCWRVRERVLLARSLRSSLSYTLISGCLWCIFLPVETSNFPCPIKNGMHLAIRSTHTYTFSPVKAPTLIPTSPLPQIIPQHPNQHHFFIFIFQSMLKKLHFSWLSVEHERFNGDSWKKETIPMFRWNVLQWQRQE